MRILLILLALTSAGMMLSTRSAPRHATGWQASGAEFEPAVADSGYSDEDTQRYFEAESRSRTRESRVNDIGVGIGALALTVLGIAVASDVRNAGDFRYLRSPRARHTIWIAVLGSWSLHIFAQIRWLNYTAIRGDYPWWADTIIIGIVGHTLAGVLVAGILAVLLAVSLAGVRLPVAMRSSNAKGIRFWICTIAFAAMIISEAPSIYGGILDGAGLLVVTHVLMLASVAMWWLAAASPARIAPGATTPAQSSPTLPTAR